MSKIINEFENVCSKNSNEVAFYYYIRKKLIIKTYKELKEDVDRVVSYLYLLGVKNGDKILAFANSDYKLCVYMLATLKIGASIMYIDIFAKQDKLTSFFNRYNPDYILVSNKSKYIRFLFRKIRKINKVINIDSKINNFSNFKANDIGENTVALLTSTTGSTGQAKIMARTHNDLYNQLKLITNNIYKCKNKEIVLTTSYMYVLANLLQGFTTVLPNLNLKRDGKYLNNKLKAYSNLEINVIITSPDFCLKTNNYYSNLEYLYFGGAIINMKEASKIKEKFNNNTNIYIYGSTECNLIAMNNLDEYINDLKTNTINNLGNIIKGVNVKIGKNNEILVNSDALLKNNIEQKFNDIEYYNTNDRGYLKNNSLIYLGTAVTEFNLNNKTYYYNQIEQDIILKYNLDKCAFLEDNSKYYLFIEEKTNINIDQYIKNNYKIDVLIKKIKRIPCDIKHHTKINYKKLRRYIK